MSESGQESVSFSLSVTGEIKPEQRNDLVQALGAVSAFGDIKLEISHAISRDSCEPAKPEVDFDYVSYVEEEDGMGTQAALTIETMRKHAETYGYKNDPSGRVYNCLRRSGLGFVDQEGSYTHDGIDIDKLIQEYEKSRTSFDGLSAIPNFGELSLQFISEIVERIKPELDS